MTVRTIVLMVSVMGLLLQNVGAGEKSSVFSLGGLIELQAVGMTDYGNAKTDAWNSALLPQLINNSASIGASLSSSRYKFSYPQAFLNIGLMGNYAFHKSWIISARMLTSGVSATDTANYRDSAGLAYDLNYNWKMNTTDFGVGVGYKVNNPANKNNFIMQLFAGSLNVKLQENLSSAYDLRPIGGSIVQTTGAPYETSYTKTYFEPSLLLNFYFGKKSPLGVTLKAGYIIVGEEKVDNYTFNASGVKLGVGLIYDF